MSGSPLSELAMKDEDDGREGDMERIKIEEEMEKEQVITVRRGAVLADKASSVWSWYEEFVAEWSKSFLTKKRKKRPIR